MKVLVSCLFLCGAANGLRFTSKPAVEDLMVTMLFEPDQVSKIITPEVAGEDFGDIQKIMAAIARASKPYKDFFLALETNRTDTDFDVKVSEKPDRFRGKKRQNFKMKHTPAEGEDFDDCFSYISDSLGINSMGDIGAFQDFGCQDDMPTDVHTACMCSEQTYFETNENGTCNGASSYDGWSTMIDGYAGNQTWCNSQTKMTWCERPLPSGDPAGAFDNSCEPKDYCPCMLMDFLPGECRDDTSCIYMCEGCYGASELKNMGATDLCIGAKLNLDSSMCIIQQDLFGDGYIELPKYVRKGFESSLKLETRLPGMKQFGDSCNKRCRKNMKPMREFMKKSGMRRFTRMAGKLGKR